MVLRLCDELDKAEDLHVYFQDMMNEYIVNNIIPQFNRLNGMDLLQNYVKQWKSFTILVHFMRKLLNYLVRKLTPGPLLPQEQQLDTPRADRHAFVQRKVLFDCQTKDYWAAAGPSHQG